MGTGASRVRRARERVRRDQRSLACICVLAAVASGCGGSSGGTSAAYDEGRAWSADLSTVDKCFEVGAQRASIAAGGVPSDGEYGELEEYIDEFVGGCRDGLRLIVESGPLGSISDTDQAARDAVTSKRDHYATAYYLCRFKSDGANQVDSLLQTLANGGDPWGAGDVFRLGCAEGILAVDPRVTVATPDGSVLEGTSPASPEAEPSESVPSDEEGHTLGGETVNPDPVPDTGAGQADNDSGPDVMTPDQVVIATDVYASMSSWEARPSTFTSGNGGKNSIDGIVWSRWGGAQAQGRATVRTNTCEPNCAQSNSYDVSTVEVTAFRKRRCGDGVVAYTRLRISGDDGPATVSERLCPPDR